MFSLPLTHLGTAFASGLFRSNNSLLEKFYKKISWTNATAYPPELVSRKFACQILFHCKFFEIKVDLLGRDLQVGTDVNSLLMHDASTQYCWGKGFMKLNDVSYESVLKCCYDNTACDFGTFQSIFYVMKESLGQPHSTSFDWDYNEFTGLLSLNTLRWGQFKEKIPYFKKNLQFIYCLCPTLLFIYSQ